MSSEAITAIIASVVTLLAALGVFMGRSGLQRVISGGTEREATAVGQMAELLGNLSTAQILREQELMGIVGQSMETVAQMTQIVTEVAGALETHRNSSQEWASTLERGQDYFRHEVQNLHAKLDSLTQLNIDIGDQVIRCAKKVKSDTGPLSKNIMMAQKADAADDQATD